MTLHEYLREAARRLGQRRGARAVAVLLGMVLLASVVGGWLVMMFIPPAPTLLVARLLLAAGLVLACLRWWRGRPDAGTAARRLETEVPAFGGRLSTWRDACDRGDRSDLFEMLGRETGRIADAHPPATVFPRRGLLLPIALAAGASGLLVWLLAGTQPWQLATQRLWLGDWLADTRPHLRVRPGDVVVRRGSDVVLRARAQGFLPGRMELSADFGGGWERAPMSDLGDGEFGFVLVGVSDRVAYYVSARGITSARYQVQVADLPRVTGVETVHELPHWTGRPDARYQRGDVNALPGTRVAVTAFTDRPVAEALLVVDGQVQPMAPEQTLEDGSVALHGAFAVTGSGSWHVAVRHEGALARISDSYFIEVADDAPPEVTFQWPGHDARATAIEEVALSFEASDDYAVESLTLRYAVNGGTWQEVALTSGIEYLLRLEGLRVGASDQGRRLAPGDVISLYAEARDHAQRTRSSLYFVDVRPFEMRYQESQEMAGQGGAAEGSGFDIAERQRDILSATWNLINTGRERNPQALADEADVLAMLQRTLRDQVQTLVERSTARGLGRDAEVSDFIAALSRSLLDMDPAASHLEAMELDEAVPAEQRALAHLAAAEASVRDVSVSLARNQGRSSGRSLSELMELEMDPQRNRYEVPQQARPDQAGAPDQADEDWQRLDELAARQEQLARRPAADRGSLPARWEQARLSRELDRMRETLQARRSAAAETADSSATDGRDALERALGDLSEARRAVDSGGGDPRQAADALRRAADNLRESSRGDLQERLGHAGRQVANLNADQARVMEALQTLQSDSLERARQGEGIPRSDFSMQTFAEVKQRMQQDLAGLRAELTALGRSLTGPDPAAARILERAVGELDDVRIDERLAASAEAFEMGQPLYVIGSEGVVQQGLQRLQRRVEQAAGSVSGQAGANEEDPLRQVRSLRRRLDDMDASDQPDRQAVTDVARALDRLLASEEGSGTPAGASTGTSDSRGGSRDGGIRSSGGMTDYRIRGTDEANTDVLLRLTRERLDLAEAMLVSRDNPPIRAQEPRQAERDSAAAARYFRELSRASDAGAADRN